MWNILGVVILAIGYWIYALRTRGNIKIRLDGFYKTNKEMATAAYEELKNKGKDCEIIKLSDSFSEIKVDDKMYYVTGMVFGFGGGLSQTIILKPLKEEYTIN